jgi:hypothetical protein
VSHVALGDSFTEGVGDADPRSGEGLGPRFPTLSPVSTGAAVTVERSGSI